MEATNRSSWKLNVKFSTFGMKTEKKNFRAPPSPVPHPYALAVNMVYGLLSAVYIRAEAGRRFIFLSRAVDGL